MSTVKSTRIILVIMTVVLFLAASSIVHDSNALAAGKTAVVTGSGVNVRSGPGTGFSKIAVVNKGAKMEVLDQKNGWYNLKLTNGKSGWVIGTYLTVTGGTTTTPPTTVPKPNKIAVVTGTNVNVRSGPGTTFGKVAKVNKGQQFPVLTESAGWYKVDLGSGKNGWIIGTFVATKSADTSSRGETKPTTPSLPPQGGQGPATGNSGDNAPKPAIKLSAIKMKTGSNGTESVVISSGGTINYSLSLMANPARLVIDLNNSDLNGLKDLNADGELIDRVRVAQYSLNPMQVRVVIDLNGPVSYVPTLSNSGKTLTVNLSEPSIDGKLVVVDAGHGGYDPGAIGVTDLKEKDYNLEAALLLKDKLTALGATVILTRDDDNFISLNGRATVANGAYADVFVSIHANSNNSSSFRGTSTYYYAPSSIPALYGQKDQRSTLARSVQGKLIEELGTKDVGVRTANFAVLRETNMPSILVETAFLSNPDDEALLKDPEFRDKVAQAIADGLVQYFAAGN